MSRYLEFLVVFCAHTTRTLSIISLCGPGQAFDDLTLSSLMEPLYLICTTISSPSNVIPSLIQTPNTRPSDLHAETK
ncbi:hypothetical protein P692DRAFT_20830491 [Suillus brevipes Sb2]|nr:hypothetical protein P692DRAFT_20830491 [Suillus brevipes Sb2]